MATYLKTSSLTGVDLRRWSNQLRYHAQVLRPVHGGGSSNKRVSDWPKSVPRVSSWVFWERFSEQTKLVVPKWLEPGATALTPAQPPLLHQTSPQLIPAPTPKPHRRGAARTRKAPQGAGTQEGRPEGNPNPREGRGDKGRPEGNPAQGGSKVSTVYRLAPTPTLLQNCLPTALRDFLHSPSTVRAN